MRSLERLNAWVERARDTGLAAIEIATAEIDPMQAELCGFALAVAPNEACYVPLGHRQGGEGGGSVPRRRRARPDCRSAQRSTRSSRCWKTTACIKIGHDLKFAWQIFAQRGIEIAAYDDTMLMSYVARRRPRRSRPGDRSREHYLRRTPRSTSTS